MLLFLHTKSPKSYKWQAARSPQRPTSALFLLRTLTFLLILRWSAPSPDLQAMSAVGILAEAYVMRKMHKEKMKRMDGSSREEEQEEPTVNAEKQKSPSSCRFIGSSKKIHPGGFPNSNRK
ncbi:hypothetical protein ACLOJK_013185 [Asimina triloba]